ncbi:cell division protein FtsP [Photorhabdus bodei]|uniref:Cell division protein FtsP n=1 Tax=Photorhabdus bodei TaxID=2029681 RepID=A0A329WYN3_9GAMM|nr:cell division protein FtsP [Photorhabdus bodei]NDL00543.1 cell division protein FtsP [Photorhabdus bodei]NDL04678.1 cell division protein FtsP [Photorhabdus bodei]NDL09003.1 cell division protein FtsP [Photorhabdus bodei]RAX09701.1 cell division protein FtsP [Photorhabdus bodei]
MSFSRRQFIQVSGLAMCIGAAPLLVRASKNQQTALPVPPLLESRGGQPLFLTLQKAHWTFDGQYKTSVWGINGQYLGPTVRVHKNDDVKLIYSNRLAEPVSMTVSGLQLPGTLTGGVARQISPGSGWSPVLPIRQQAATCWYHANTPNRMAPHVYKGLAGMWLVEDETSRHLPLPKHYGVNDFPVILQDKRLDNFGVPEYQPASDSGFIGNTLLVNGVQNPFIEVSRGWIRLRLLNASNARRYQLQIGDGRPFYMIGTDLGLLPAPIAVQQLSLAPGERREVLIDMSKEDEVVVTAGESAGVLDKLRGLFEPSTVLISSTVLTIKATGLLSLVTDNLPSRLVDDVTPVSNAIRNREIYLDDNTPGINGALWNMNRVDITSQQGTWERWIVNASAPQPFHIEGVQFKVINHNGEAPQPQDYGWKDTVWVDGRVELLVYMSQPSYEHFPFLYYSQILEMADRGSVGQLVTIPVNQ